MVNTKDPDPILLEKYLAIKRSRKARRKRVPANTWIKTRKLPTDFEKRRKPPKIDDDDELDTALTSLGVIHCSSSDLDDPKVSSNQFAVTSIEDDISFIMDQNNLDPNGFQQFQLIDPQLDMQAFNDIFNNPESFELTTTTNPQDLVDLQFNQFNVGPPQESILSTTSPFPSSMSSPSIPSTSPEQQSDEPKVPDIHPSPPQTIVPSQCPPLPSTVCSYSIAFQPHPQPQPQSSPNASCPPPQPSYECEQNFPILCLIPSTPSFVQSQM